jgi:hypothetical protein
MDFSKMMEICNQVVLLSIFLLFFFVVYQLMLQKEINAKNHKQKVIDENLLHSILYENFTYTDFIS